MTAFIATLLVSASLYASQDLNDSSDSNQQAISALKQSFGVAQSQMNSQCVQPTQDLMCNSTTATIVNTLGGILSQISSAATNGTGSQAISGAISGVSCVLIKCDTTTSRNDLCTGVETVSVCQCPKASVGFSPPPPPCKSGKQTAQARQACVDNSWCCGGVEPEGCAGTYGGLQTNCDVAIQKCDLCKQKDDSKIDNNYMCDGDYTTCIKSYKTQAKARQIKCISLCDSMVALLAAFKAQQLGVDSSLTELQKQTTAASGNTNNNTNTNNNSNSNNNNALTASDDNTSSTLGKFLSLFNKNSNKNNNNSSATTSGIAETSTTGSVGASSGTSSLSLSSRGSGSVEESEATTTVSNGVAGEAESSASSDSGSSNSKIKLKGLKKSNIGNEYLALSQDLFVKVSEIHSSYYHTGAIGENINSNVKNKKVRR